MAQLETPSREPNPRLVLIRFAIRVATLLAFTGFGSVGFGKSLAALLATSAILCIVVAFTRREIVFPRTRRGENRAHPAAPARRIPAAVRR